MEESRKKSKKLRKESKQQGQGNAPPSLASEEKESAECGEENSATTKGKARNRRKKEKKLDQVQEDQSYDAGKEMERDAEFRRLNAKIKEQEYRMRQMELNSKANRDHANQIAKKVEEEVRQKLKKATIMSAMYKSNEISSRSSTSGNRQEPPKSRSADDNLSHGAGEKSIEKPHKSISHIRLDKDSAPFKNQRKDVLEVVDVEDVPTRVKEKEKVFLRLESDIKKRIDEIRKDRSALQDFCILGPSNGAPEYALMCAEFENMIFEALNRGDILQACRERYCHKLTEMKLKQMGLFHAVISSAMNSDARVAKEGLLTQIAGVFRLEIAKSEMAFTSALQIVQIFYQRQMIAQLSRASNSICPRSVLSEAEDRAVRSSLSNILSSIGELRKFEIALVPHKDSLDWSQAISFYQEAIKVSPFEGTHFRQLTQISRSQGDNFQAAYYLSLSLMTEDSFHASRETLLEIFELSRTTAEQFPLVTALSRLSQQEHIGYFQPHFLAAVGIAYSRTSADMFAHHMERCRRHLSTILQLLIIDILHELESGKGHKGDFTQFDHLGLLSTSHSQEKSSTFMDGLSNRATELSEMIRQALVIVISLLELISRKHNLSEFYKSVSWSQCYLNGTSKKPIDLTELSLEEKLVLEKRYNIQCLHKVQSIPGFLDLSRLLLGLIASLISSEGVGIGTRTGVTSNVHENNTVTSILLTATCPGVSLFFDWISEHPEYHILSVLDKTAWEQMESDLAIYVSALSNLTKINKVSLSMKRPWKEIDHHLEIDATTCLLKEDFSLQGFLPLQALVRRRYEEFISLLGLHPHISEALLKPDDSLPLDELFELCNPFAWVSSLPFASNLVVYAQRCVKIVRSLCQQTITFGEPSCGIFFDKFRQTIYPSSPDIPWNSFFVSDNCTPDPKQCLCVIVYRAPMLMRASGFMSSGFGGKTSILTEAEFLQGTRNQSGPQEVVEDFLDPVTESFEPSKSDEVITALPLAIQKEADPSESQHVDTGEIFPQEKMISGQVQANAEKGLLRVSVPSASVKKKNVSSHRSTHNKDTELPLIVIDTPNVAMRHGLNTKFSCRGIKLAIDFFHAAGHRVVAFLPDYYFNFERVGELRRAATLGVSSVRASQIPDDVQLLQQLLGQGFLIGTPAQDYDDSYCINYAKQRGGYIISNDLYRDHLKRYESGAEREEVRKWLKSHVISYTFVGDEFLPNPDASIK